ncbi:hypothetical protein [Bizionia paragorgiae]|uniref:hypothetical protein n=1 Tax=Bizionia paragorgiae TaxID=283786 RepID=UPI003A9061AA
MIAPIPFDRVQYTLSYPNEPSLTIKEIKNWKDDEKEYKRNTDYDGIVAKYSSNLEFTGDGMNFILFIDEVYDINAKIFLRKEERHPKTDAWVETYSGYLDLATLDIGETSILIKLSSGGLEQLLKARETEQVEIDRLTTLDGATLPRPTTVDVQMDGRKIFLLSKMEQTDKNLIEYTSISPRLVPPLTQIINSDRDHIKSTLNNVAADDYSLFMDGSGHYYPEKQQFFYEMNDRYKVLNLEFDLEFGIQIYPGGSTQYPDVYLEIRKYFYEDGVGYTLTGDYLIHKWVGTPRIGLQTLTLNTINSPYPIEIEKDESLMFIIWRDSPFATTMYKPEKTEMIITENSFFEPTKCKMMLAHDLGSRLAKIITNKDCFYSQATGRIGLNDYTSFGFAEATGFANGLALREFFKDDTDEQNKYKPLTTSFRDFADAMQTTHNLRVGIETINKRERLRMEEVDYFYQPNITIKLGQVNNVRRKKATEYYYSGLETGFAKGGEYEESMGLDEYNGKSTFTTVITGLKNVFKSISPYRADSYGAEFARRKTKKYYPLEDTRYDQDIFQFDLKRMISSMNIRKWADDFTTLPSGVYSPETAYNLRYSPANLILRHGRQIASGLIKYPLDYIRYGSSTANSNLTTKLIGGVEVSENGGESGIIIQNKDLPKAKFIPQWIDFEYECDFEVMQQVEGFTTVLGKRIPNFYGLVEFTNEKGSTERGYLFTIAPNGVGRWRVLKSNR